METAKSLKRVFVGGLHHLVSESEIKEIFSSFGDVTAVDVVFRKDNQGNPAKVFGYVNINISETELKRCMSVLNKSKWKGGKLQIELAKECFLHRLAQERQDIAKNKHKPHVDSIAKVVESLKKAGVENFKIKSAVPGTEVPDHKDWIVSKFGRVLPILHLQQNNKKKIKKYDPSKYCHNIKKLDHLSDSEIKTPVTKLTWHLDEQDDEETNKKRRGIFPTQTQTVKRKKLSLNKYSVESFINSDCNIQTNKIRSDSVKHNASRGFNEHEIDMTGNKFVFPESASCAGFKNQNLVKEETTAATKNSAISKARIACHDSDTEELELITEEEKSKRLSQTDVKEQDIPLEVVGEDYILKHETHWALVNSKRQMLKGISNDPSNRSGSDYDSADTDEIISTKMIPCKKLPQTKANSKADFVNGETEVNTGKGDCESQSNSSNEDTVDDNSESSVDTDYEEMTRNCYRIDLSLTDLEQLANKSSESKETNSQSEKSELDFPKNKSLIPFALNLLPNSGMSLSQDLSILNQRTISDNMFSVVQNEDSSDSEMGSNKQLSNLLSCKDTHCLSEVKKTNSRGVKKEKVNGSRSVVLDSDSDVRSSCKPPPFKGTKFLQISTFTTTSPSYSVKHGMFENEEKSKSEMHKMCNSTLMNKDKFEESKEDVKGGKQTTLHTKPTNPQKIDLSSSSVTKSVHEKIKIESTDGSESSISPGIENTTCSLAAGSPQNLNKRLSDNQKRLAAVQQRQKEAEVQKKLIQGALSDLEGQKAGKGKHIVFDYEEEPESETVFEGDEDSCRAEDANTSAESRDRKLVAKDFKSRTIGKLFDSEEEEDDNDDHSESFKIKPQFEGKAGQKLLALQSRFGTDERFRMDERFLESEDENMEESVTIGSQDIEEEELVAEKRRALNILKSVVQDVIEKTEVNKEHRKLKHFKDVSALHYDPTRKDHIIYENKFEESKKESKAERKKRKEEEEKLPEVSKEIYYDVNKDLKGMFASSTKEKEVAWDKKDESQLENQCPESLEMPTIQHTFDFLSSKDAVKKDSTNFTFSFFEAAAHDSSQKPEHYKTEPVTTSAVPWHEDPRFQDSSSEDEGEIENCEDDTAESLVPFPEKKANFFFFFRDDQRLKDGPKLFCRTTDLTDERDVWEENRALLIEEYREKHKAARQKRKDKQ
ncbi:nucleolar protein 8 [Pristis pectinata]|uniref:nucleolar protein 8 n=1 Tax=Pristis pectinata TaxID=685728 RepID=UPI00223E6F40|nr:nucleolar protein 8 [Pristis pectinata]XP_051874869.1 nucleolar protein 8 [Pristis pectinata]XP_051874870.1 nucleolar protein 8 [Pristis pectinata]XP_051874871.1 nucleolar protein 8 [Pristis pectinata]